MRIILISPYPDATAFGLRTLSACLKAEKHDVQILFLLRDFTDRYEEDTLDDVVAISRGADLIGISLMTNFFDNAVQITQKLKRMNAPILWGGIHATIRPEECLEYADLICVGEGEEAIVELARKMEDGQGHFDVPGIWLRDKDAIVRNNTRPLIQDLDSVPFPDYDCQTHYVLDGRHVRKMDQDLFGKYTNGLYVTMPTRGCPFGCSYCCNNTLNSMYPAQKLPRKRSVDNIIAELTRVRAELPSVRYIKFDDDAFFLYDLADIRDFGKKYKDNIGLPLIITGATPTTLTREKLSLLVDAGLVFVRMGIQSASERVNRTYKRRHSRQQVEEAVKIMNEFKDKIWAPQYDIILDNPWETDDDRTETLMFLSKLPTPYRLLPFSLTFYPETELYRRAKEDGLIPDELRDVYRKNFNHPRKTYLNRLFFLLDERASRGNRLSPRMMSLLTNRTLRRLRLGWLVYALLKIDFLVKTRQLRSVLRETLKPIHSWHKRIV